MEHTSDEHKKLLNRATLAELFKDGMRPSGVNFSHLIHSTVNKLDDGIEKSFDHGLSLAPQGNTAENLISFFNQIDDENPAWSIGITSQDDNTKNLNFKNGGSEVSRLYINEKSGIGINTTDPKHSLDVKGDIGIESRKGTYATGELKADGKWHKILKNEKGCTMFEITACAKGMKGAGKYAMLYAIAQNPYAGKYGKVKRIRSHYGWKWWRRIQIRWVGDPFNYSLEIRTASHYGRRSEIEYHVTKIF